jgi:hypothetical protein
MIVLAHNCATLGITVDFGKLFYADDPDYIVALSAVVDLRATTERG